MLILKKIDKALALIMDIIPVILVCFLLLLLTANIFFRLVPIYRISCYNEVVEISFAWLIFIGAASLWRRKEHTIVDFLPRKFEGTAFGGILRLFIELLSIAFILIFIQYSYELMERTTAVSPILQIPRKYFYLSMPISGVIMLIYSIKNIITIFSSKSSKNSGTVNPT